MTVADARRLLPPELADRSVRPVASGGTVNAVFRVGDDLALRVPLRPFDGDLREPDVLRVLAPHLPVAVPRPYAHDAERGWTIQQWLPGNILLRDGRLVGLIDFAGAGVGDPACDLMVFWDVLGRSDRAYVRDRLGLDDDTWHRGAAWALARALTALPYYRHSNPYMAASARHAIRAVLGR